MKKLLFQSGVLLLLLTLMSTGHAKPLRVISVFCDQGDSIQDAVDRVKDRARIDVYGTCTEEVVITEDNLQIVAVNGATIVVPAGRTGFRVFADNVIISDFIIMGGMSGVRIFNGASARLFDNQILESTRAGIFIRSSSYGGIFRNVLHSTSGNFSQIFVEKSSSADITDNIITASSGTGISVTAASAASVGDNNVSGTVFHGIGVSQNSHMFFTSANTVNNPVGLAIFCSVSSSMRVAAAPIITAGPINVAGCDIELDPGVVFP